MAFRNEQMRLWSFSVADPPKAGRKFQKSVSCIAMSDLKTIIESHAAQFAHAIIASLKDLSIDDIVRLSKAQGAAAAAPAAKPAAAPVAKAAIVKVAPAAKPAPAAKAVLPAKAKAAPAVKAKAKAPPAAKPARAVKAAKPARAVAAKAAPAPKANAKKTATGRLARRSLADIDATLDLIVGLLKKTPGLRSEQIGAALGLDKKEIPRPVMEGLDRGLLSKAGERRGTTYYVEKKK